ncbi:SAM-dependent methyltransferase [Brevundimonas sp.]|jgi:SAM-dependent methyltransferase|uniref:SAM-dependent methyltransferase n=1 Tax=Brevundimonas sp. TaxID=1871086 RepID=UPI0037C16887
MIRGQTTLGADYFEGIFAGDDDPWGLETRAYESKKRERTLAILGGERFEAGLEIGCAAGVLTAQLAPYCKTLLAIDVSETALKRARRRLSDYPQVRFQCAAFPEERPDLDRPDLMVLSEVAYYWSDADLIRAGRYIEDALQPGGVIVLVHWLGETDYPQTGDGAVAALARTLDRHVEVEIAERHSEYRLDLWRRR